MSSEIVIPETPFWLNELEAKREKRLKVRLGHEAGAGAPCLKCGDKCPGLDLHFWRKCCKICKCSKEEHEVQDDDIYGWAQFQLLGSKPNKIKKKILLPGKKDELELDWAPKGHNETVDKYLKTLSPEQLPVKGSQAAQDRKQLLQKQIPVHDVDPTLCHELTEDELKKMNEYIAHVKQSSVGVGQIVSLSSIIRGNLHIINPGDAAILANRYSKGVPTAEIVTLQAQSRSEALKQHNLSENLQKLNLNEKNLPNFICNNSNVPQDIQNGATFQKIHDINYPAYNRQNNQTLHPPQFSSKFKPNCYKPSSGNKNDEPAIDERMLQNPNFDPKKIPSEFVTQYPPSVENNLRDNNLLRKHLDDYKSGNSAFVPYSKIAPVSKPGESNFYSGIQYTEESILQNPNYSRNIPNYTKTNSPLANSIPCDPKNSNILIGESELNEKNIHEVNYLKIPLETTLINTDQEENVKDLKRVSATLPNYTPGKYNIFPDNQSPTRLAKNVKDLAFSTYDPNNIDPNELTNELEPGYKQKIDLPEDPFIINQHITKQIISGTPNDLKGILKSKNTNALSQQLGSSNTLDKSNIGNKDIPYYLQSDVNDQKTCSSRQNESRENLSTIHKQHPLDSKDVDVNQTNYPWEINKRNVKDNINKNSPRKKLSELLPINTKLNEDFLQPSQVTIGSIQDVNYPEIKAAVHGTNDFYEDYSPDSIKEILNNIKLPDCHYCKKSFEENEFAVTIDRANVLFHANCFKCAGCNQILADNVYFYNKETDNIYCGRDYAKVRGFPRCKACDELIFTKEYCLAENATFHLKHFCCMECDTPLAGQDYTLEDEMPYCLPCFEQNKANKCSGCGQIIKPDEIGCAINGVHFHVIAECFACKICHKPLMGEKLLLRNEKLYCSHNCFGTEKK